METTKISYISNNFITPSIPLVSSFPSFFLVYLSCPRMYLYSFIFTRTYTAEWLTATNCLLTCITVFLLLLAKKGNAPVHVRYGFKVVLGREKCDFFIFLFQYQVLNLQPFIDKTLPSLFETCSSLYKWGEKKMLHYRKGKAQRSLKEEFIYV